MNPFQRARDQALETRTLLTDGNPLSIVSARNLLLSVEDKLNIAIEPINKSFPDLGGGSAVLIRSQRFIYVNNEIEPWSPKFCSLIGHELGHWYLDSQCSPTKVSHLKELFGSEGTSSVMKVEAYGAREREELQANVYARELLLPRELARKLAANNHTPSSVSELLGIPLEYAQIQMLDALFLPVFNQKESQLKEPSIDQIKAAQSEARASNVVAGPGTGKTTTLIHRIKHLIKDKGVDPSEILVLTFTNKAAFELIERLRGIGVQDVSNVWAGTFHAFGLEFLRKYHHHFRLEPDIPVTDLLSTISMLTSALPSLDLMHYLRTDDPIDWLIPVINGIKRLKEELISPDEYRRFILEHPCDDSELQSQRHDVATLYAAHEALLRNRQEIDFVDLISLPALALKENRAPFVELADRFKYVLVDEYQDVTQAMVELLRQIGKSKSIWVVGDIRQAIHHWRGASLKSLLKFDQEFKAHANGTQIQRYTLNRNRRSSQEILNLVEEVGRQHRLESQIPLAPMTAEKGPSGLKPVLTTCHSRTTIPLAIVKNIQHLKNQGVAFRDQAVLCRSVNEVTDVAEALKDSGIPIVYVGDISQRVEIKQIYCLMQLLVERNPKSLIGLKGIDGLDMPLADIEALLEKTKSRPTLQRGRWLNHQHLDLSLQGQQAIRNLNQLIGKWNRQSSTWALVCDLLLESRFNVPGTEENSVEAWVSKLALWQFCYAVRNGAANAKDYRLYRFLIRQHLRQRIGEELASRELPPEAEALDGVRLLTVHGSKGLEFDAVHLGYASSGYYSSKAPTWRPEDDVMTMVPPESLGSNKDEYDMEEAVERNNLLYVAVSRARNHLYIYQDGQFGRDNFAPQWDHYPKKYLDVDFSENYLPQSLSPAVNRFTPEPEINYEHFRSYVTCSLQYWYSRILKLKPETDIDISIQTRWAIMHLLKRFAGGEQIDPNEISREIWSEYGLPDQVEDPKLWKDANTAFSKGIDLIKIIISKGGILCEPKSIVGGVTIQLPWGFILENPHSVEFAMIKFSRSGVSSAQTILKPVVPGLLVQGSKKLSLHYVMSDKSDNVPGARRIESTKSFKAAVNYLSGVISPSKGRHCSRCAYANICPSAPVC
ncbi:MAG: ATP-dependent helicase [Alcanivoracaceae bacterium]|nr:ATP-dependent helicase [Alcanivoracaceae bacterium]